MFNENMLAPEQRTEQWHLDRAGKFTGSRFKDLLSFNAQGEPNKAHLNLLQQLVGERLTGRHQDNDVDSKAMKNGRELEEYAVTEYEMQTGNVVKPATFMQHPKIPFAGVSADGFTDELGELIGIEVKCPLNWDIHLARFEFGMEDYHQAQVQGGMWVTGAKCWDFISYHPLVSPHLRFYRERIYRDEAYIKNLENQVLLAEKKVRDRLKFYEEANIEAILNERTKPHEQHSNR